MLISHKHKFIFVHIYKNAGTSISSALLPCITNKFQRFTNRQLSRVGITYLAQPCSVHAKASEIMTAVGAENFKSYFSFCIVRNPWDWQVSLYKYMLKNSGHPQHELIKRFQSFENYLEWRCTKEIVLQKDFIYSPSGERLINFVGRFESLEQDFQIICKRIGLSAHLSRVNVSNTVPYREFYNQTTQDMVKSAFEADIALFNYSF